MWRGMCPISDKRSGTVKLLNDFIRFQPLTFSAIFKQNVQILIEPQWKREASLQRARTLDPHSRIRWCRCCPFSALRPGLDAVQGPGSRVQGLWSRDGREYGCTTLGTADRVWPPQGDGHSAAARPSLTLPCTRPVTLASAVSDKDEASRS